ncbi:MAG: 50S ribosomal protein L23 [Bdellovibrionota bacterium]
MINIIKRPLVTEKNTYFAGDNVYVFEVDKRANKTDVKSAVQKVFGVKVEKVRTQNCRGRSKNNKFGKSPVPHWKKAYVKLVAGEKIAMFEGA